MDADPEAVAEVANKLFLTDVPVEDLDPVVQRTLEVASTEWTDEMQDKLMECLGTDVCETGNDGYVIAFPNDNINPWRQTFRAELTAQAIQSGNVSKIIYSLGTDVPTWLANFKSLVAQQPDIIVIDSIYGPAILPALQQAKSAGITVVDVETPLPEEVASFVDVQATVGPLRRSTRRLPPTPWSSRVRAGPTASTPASPATGARPSGSLASPTALDEAGWTKSTRASPSGLRRA